MHTRGYTNNPVRITKATRERSSMFLSGQIRKGLPGSNSPGSYTSIWVDITGICLFQMHCIIMIMVAYSCFSI